MSIYLDFDGDGDSPVCETCGPSYDECKIDYEGGVWTLSARWGCTGGDRFEGTRAELIAYLDGEFRREWGHLFAAESIDGALRELGEA